VYMSVFICFLVPSGEKWIHENITAQSRLHGKLLEGNDFYNGLWQGCTVALTFNLYSCVHISVTEDSF